ncbi:hypothetical protein C8R43DRAFT_1019393, partial [Mycena crocata]
MMPGPALVSSSNIRVSFTDSDEIFANIAIQDDHDSSLAASAISSTPIPLLISASAHNDAPAAHSSATRVRSLDLGILGVLFFSLALVGIYRRRHGVQRVMRSFIRRLGLAAPSAAPGLPAAFDVATGLIPLDIPPPALIPEVVIPSLENLLARPTPSTPGQAHLPATPERPPASTTAPRPNPIRRRRDTLLPSVAGPSSLRAPSESGLALSTPVRLAYSALEAGDNSALTKSGQKRVRGMVDAAKNWARPILGSMSFNPTANGAQADNEQGDGSEEGSGSGGVPLSDRAKGKQKARDVENRN